MSVSRRGFLKYLGLAPALPLAGYLRPQRPGYKEALEKGACNINEYRRDVLGLPPPNDSGMMVPLVEFDGAMAIINKPVMSGGFYRVVTLPALTQAQRDAIADAVRGHYKGFPTVTVSGRQYRVAAWSLTEEVSDLPLPSV